MEQLALEVFNLTGSGSQYANLEPDASITITDTSEIFDSGDVWTHQFTLNIPANAHLFGTSGELHGSRLHEQINKRRARLWVMGLPLYYGYLRLDDEVEVDNDGNVDVSFESGQKTFKDMIDGGKANQVPLMTDVQFGVALWRKRIINTGLRLKAYAVFKDGYGKSKSSIVTEEGYENISIMANGDHTSVQQYPRTVYPKGRFVDDSYSELHYTDVDFLNTDYPYDDAHPYCNVALCYQKKDFPKNEDGSVDYSKEPEAQRGYEVMPANRVNSAPNFYVIYWLRSLMKYIGINIDENQMMDIEDMRRLFFVNTKCAYEEPEYLRGDAFDERYGRYQFGDNRYLAEKTVPCGLVKTEDSSFVATSYDITRYPEITPSMSVWPNLPVIDSIVIQVDGIVPKWSEEVRRRYKVDNGYLHKAFATPECFPDEDIDTVIDALQNAFGIRLLFDKDFNRVRIVLLRNLFRDSEVHDIPCEITEITKTENSIRGFRMTFGDTEDTAFYYKGFADKLPGGNNIWADNSDKHDYSWWDTDAQYKDIINKISAFDRTCFVVPDTGNAYVIKVDKDAKRYDDLHPSLFGCADFMDAEDGDCTGEENTVKEIQVGFKPAIMNDVNFENERNEHEQKQQFALFVEEEMRPRRYDFDDLSQPKSYNDSDALYDVDGKLYEKKDDKYVYSNIMAGGIAQPGMFAITSDTMANKTSLQTTVRMKIYVSNTTGTGSNNVYESEISWDIDNLEIDGHVNEGYRLYLQDNFEPNDDGVSPIETHEWGVTLGIMRGSGNDAYVDYSPDPDDGEDNQTWDIVPGSSVSAHPDTCDDYGKIFDYNGSIAVDDAEGAILKMPTMWPDSNINLIYYNGQLRNNDTYISSALATLVEGADGKNVNVLLALALGKNGHIDLMMKDGRHIDDWEYLQNFRGMTAQQMYAWDADTAHGGLGVLIEVGGSIYRMRTLLDLQSLAFETNSKVAVPIIIDTNGVGSMYGRFSLKLRSEKLNPFFDPTQPESAENPRYIEITNPNLRRRGLADQFYKEYSYWVRNARIANIKARIGLAELLSIDKTKRQRIGNITGFIKKMQYTVSNKTGLGLVEMEVWYL